MSVATARVHIPDSTANSNAAQRLFDEGFALHAQGRLAQAQALYEQVLAIEPGHFGALHMTGVIAYQSKDPQRSVDLIGRALENNSRDAAAYYNHGVALQALGQHTAAAVSYERAIALKAGYADAHNNLGIALQELGRFDAALQSFERALALQPDHVRGHNNLGNARRALNHPQAAVECYERALALAPAYAEAHDNRGVALADLDSCEAALAGHERALALDPGRAGAYYNRGNALRDLRRYECALQSYGRALILAPGEILVHINRGNALRELKRYEAALAAYQQALALDTQNASAHLNSALCLLQLGNYARGWEEYEWRWREAQTDTDRRDYPQPLWLGAPPLAGKSILLHSEQGLGDTLQFCRYLPLLARAGAHVLLEVQPPLAPLFAGFEGAALVLPRGTPLPAFDYHCPLLSLPLAFRTELDDIPLGIPYIRSDAARVSAWSGTLGAKVRPRIGVAWSGSAKHTNDRNRSIALAQLLPMFSANVEWISLQQEVRVADAQVLAAHPEIHHYGEQFTNFADTAALLELMDLVVTVDTVVAHLAGAMGKPVWILLPYNSDWRWLLDREDSVWYPSARLFRQPEIGDWASVMLRVSEELDRRYCTAGAR